MEQADDMLKGMKDEQIKSLNDAISDINNMIKERTSLCNEIFTDIEKIKIDINNFILDLGDDENKNEQLSLRQKQVEIEEVKLQEKINAWRDIAKLKEELREKVQELHEKESRASMLDTILE